MKRVAVSQLKNRLSEYLRLVKRGEIIEIVERSIPIARIEGIGAGGADSPSRNAEFERLVREGAITAPKRKLDKAFFSKPPIPCSGDAVRAVIEDRDGR